MEYRDFISDLSGCTLSLSEVGGKALGLSAMSTAGFRVPPGFVILVRAYYDFMKYTGLETEIGKVLDTIDYDNADSLSEGTARIRDMIRGARVPRSAAAFINEAVASMGGEYYAVRSSAVAEDLPDASFAGQQDTYLNVRQEDVVARTLDCWASYWNERAVKYRQDAGIKHLETGMAVVVQKMVASEISGVMFTVNPMDGSDDLVIESSWGLGESIASGVVTPDRFVVKRDGTVVRADIKSKDCGFFLVDGKNTLMDIPSEKREARTADDAVLKEVADLGMRLEAHFGVPQDVEWARENGTVYLLQSRAVTTLTDESERDGYVWTRAYGDEYWADATTPMFFSVMGKMLSGYVTKEGASVMGYNEISDVEFIKLHKSRVYFNAWALERVFSHYPKFIRSKEILNYFPVEDQARVAAYPDEWGKTVLSQLFVMIRDADGMMNRTDKAYKKWASEFADLCAEFDSIDLSSLSDESLMEWYHKIDDKSIKHYRLIRYGMVSHSIATNLMIKSWLASWLGDKDGVMYASLISGLPNNKTVETNIGFSDMAKVVRDDPELKKRIDSMSSKDFLEWATASDCPFKEKYDSFIQSYGHRSNTREILCPRWKEDPSYIISVVKLLSDSDLDLRGQESARREEREAMQIKVVAEIKKLNAGRIKAKLFSIVLGLAQTYLTFRENQRFCLDHILFRERLVIKEAGRRLCQKGVLSEGDDVFFLFEGEMFDLMSGKEIESLDEKILSRKEEFYRYQNTLPPKFVRNGIDFDDTVALHGSNSIQGAASSPGIYKGRARVVETIEGLSEVQPGDILITSNTDPGWTAAFSKLGALITETGGILSHGAVISREYKIPAVTAVKQATTTLHTGQILVVDGNEGIVYIEEEE